MPSHAATRSRDVARNGRSLVLPGSVQHSCPAAAAICQAWLERKAGRRGAQAQQGKWAVLRPRARYPRFPQAARRRYMARLLGKRDDLARWTGRWAEVLVSRAMPHRRHIHAIGRAKPPLVLIWSASAETAALGEADADLLEAAARSAALHGDHIRPQAGIRLEELGDELARPDGQSILTQSHIALRNLHLLIKLPSQAEIRIDAKPRAG